MPGGADMMMKWIQRDGTKKSVDIDAIVRMEFVPNKKYGHPMLTVMTCDIVDTIAGCRQGCLEAIPHTGRNP